MAKIKTYNCTQCGKEYKTSGGLAKHIIAAHEAQKVVEKVEETVRVIHEDARKPIGKYVFGGIALIAIVAIIWQQCNKNAVQENEEKIKSEQAKIDSLQTVIDSLQVEKQSADSIAVIALDMAEQAEQNSKIKKDEYESSKREGQELRESSQKKFNQLKEIIADPSVDKRSAIEQILRANREVDKVTGKHR